jgi:hypothetical protein
MGVHGLHKWWYRCLQRAGIIAAGVTHGRKMHMTRHTAGQVTVNRSRQPARDPLNQAAYGPGRNRTCDLALRRRALYPLSYWPGSPQSSRG